MLWMIFVILLVITLVYYFRDKSLNHVGLTAAPEGNCMDERKYTVVKQYLGIELLKYSLNYDQNSNLDASFLTLNFTEQQLSALSILDESIRRMRHAFIDSDGFGDGFPDFIGNYTISNENVFAYCRKMCKGEILHFTSDDKLLEFICNIAIKQYPNLLIKSSVSKLLPMQVFRTSSFENGSEFVRLIRADVLNNLTNKKNDFEYCFQFETTNNLKINTQVFLAFDMIISRSFENCCYKMKYSLNDFISEVEQSINKLRALARGEEVTFSVFLGAGGVIFQNTGVIDFSDCVLRPINSLVNPGQNIQLVVSTYNTESGNLLAGGIVEVIYTIKANQSAQFTNYISSKELGEHCQRCLEKLKFSLCFALNEDYAFISAFEENGFPLISPGNYSYSTFRGIQKNITIRNSNIEELKGWYQSLSRIGSDIEYIQIPLKRLNYAIHERRNPEDAIIDAVIAWEAFFSDAPETSFKVTGSIAKFLKSGSEVPILFKRLRDLYTLRSDIVHGKENKKFDYSNLNAVRSEVIMIALECLKKLINNAELLKMLPSERCKKILVYS